ncbi:MAG: serine/threonine-protein kinase [Waterburya sp.]
MSTYPDLLSYGYQIESELGRNREGGRITWKGVNLATQEAVVIKQFCFAQANSSWSGYKAYSQEIKVLQTLKHNHIPQYLDSIETEDGFCLIQEYIAADNCSNYRQLTMTEVKQIASNILDILVYLQQQSPPILHRDLKPENILLDDSLNTYLIDFGFSSLGSQEISSSSFFKGTPGFIAPEQIIKPTVASDIYGLGVTLVYLLTDKDIEEIRTSASADNPSQLNLSLVLPHLDWQFLGWLEKMTSAKVSQRFPDALAAKNALAKLDLPVESPDRVTLNISTQLKLLDEPKIIVGTLAISGLTTIALWIINFAYIRVESTIINIAIAILAVAAISVTQLGAAAIVSSERQARLQGAALSIIIPTILVAVSSLIWGIEEAVIISTAIAIAEIFILSYCWWQISAWKSHSIVRAGSWLSAIALGIILGLKLIRLLPNYQ